MIFRLVYGFLIFGGTLLTSFYQNIARFQQINRMSLVYNSKIAYLNCLNDAQKLDYYFQVFKQDAWIIDYHFHR